MYLTFCFRWGWVGVASLTVRFLGAPVILGSGYSTCLCFLVLRWACCAFGCHRGALGVALGYGSRGMGSLGQFVVGWGYWGLGARALVVSECKWIACLCSAMTGFCSRILGAAVPLGGSVLLISQDVWFEAILGAGLGVWLCLLGLWGVVPERVWSLMRGREAAAI